MSPGNEHATDRSVASTLIRRVRELDESAWEQLVDLFSPFVYGWLRSRDISEDDAVDLVQKVFTKVAAGITSFERNTQGSSFRGWLWTITHQEANDHLQTQLETQRGESGLDTVPEQIDEVQAVDESVALLHKILHMIKPDFSEQTFQVFWRFEIDGHATEQIANECGMEKSAVREARRQVTNRLYDECIELLGKGFWPFDESE